MSVRLRVLLFFLLLYGGAAAQNPPLVLQRSPASVVVTDANLKVSKSLTVPIYNDTSSALAGVLDSLGMVIQIRSTGVWYKRDTISGRHFWNQIASGGSTDTTHLSSRINSKQNDLTWLPITYYGAVADSSTDATAAIQACVDSITRSAKRKGVIYTPPGVYWVSGTVHVPYGDQISFIGAGGSVGEVSNAISKWVTNRTTGYTLVDSADNPHLERFDIANMATSPTAGGNVLFTGRLVHMEHMILYGGYDNVDEQQCLYSQYLFVSFLESVHHAVDLSNNANPDEGDPTFLGCIWQSGTWTPQHATAVGIYQTNSGGIKIQSCKVNGSGTGIVDFYRGHFVGSGNTTSDLLINGNSVENYTGHAVWIDVPSSANFGHIEIAGNQIASYASAGHGILLDGAGGGLHNIAITGNVITSLDTAIQAYHLDHLKISGNDIDSGGASNTVTLKVIIGSVTDFYFDDWNSGSSSGSAGGDLTGIYPNPTIAANKVTNAKAAQMAAGTIKGNPTGSTANPSDMTASQLVLLLKAIVDNTGSVQFVEYGNYAAHPTSGVGMYVASDSLATGGIFYDNNGTMTNLTPSVTLSVRGKGQPGDTSLITLSGNLVTGLHLNVAAIRDSGSFHHVINPDSSWTLYASTGSGSDSGFAVQIGPNTSNVPIQKYISGGARFIRGDTSANNPGAIVTQASRQKLSDSLQRLNRFLADPQSRIGVGTLRSTPLGGHGSDIEWGWVGPSQTHSTYVFSSWIQTSSIGFVFYYPTMDTIQFFGVCDDESLSGHLIQAGASMDVDNALVDTWFPIVPFGVNIVGNGTSTPTVNQQGGVPPYIITYTPSTGTFEGYSTDTTFWLDYSAMSAVYQGPSNYHFKRIFSGLGGNNQFGFVLLDEGGNVVNTAITSSDVVVIGGQSTPTSASLGQTTMSGYPGVLNNNPPFNPNYWIIMVGRQDPLDPSPVTTFTETAGGTAGTMVLAWAAMTNATTYTVQRSTHPQNGFTTVYSGSGTGFTDTGLTSGTIYYYIIQAVNGSATSPYGKTLDNGWSTTTNTIGVAAP